jgi:competence protein ComEA
MSLIRKIYATTLLLFVAAIAVAGPVNVNKADAPTLAAELTGVGLAKAQAIVEHREQYGPFKSVEDLMNVPGIGVRTLEINKEFIRLSDEGRSRKD